MKNKSEIRSNGEAKNIIVRNCSTFNLRNIFVEVPRTGLTIVAGPSGCGKSALLKESLRAESIRRLERASGSSSAILAPQWEPRHNLPRHSGGNETAAPTFPEIAPVVPVIDLDSRLEKFGSTGRFAPTSITVGEWSGISLIIRRIFSEAATFRCADDHGLLVSNDEDSVCRKFAAFRSKLSNPPDQTVLICGVIEFSPRGGPKKKAPAEAVAKLNAAFAAGSRRFILSAKYFRCKNDDEFKEFLKKTALAACSEVLVVLESVPFRKEVPESESKDELLAALRRSDGKIYNRRAVIPAAGAESLDVSNRIDFMPGIDQCSVCGREIDLSNLRHAESDLTKLFEALKLQRVEMDFNGINFSDIFQSKIGGPCSAVFDYFKQGRTRDTAGIQRQPWGVMSADAMLDLINESGLSNLRLNQPISTLSSAERILLMLISVAAVNCSGMVFLISHLSPNCSPADLSKLAALIERIVADSNGLIIEERNLDSYAGMKGHFIRLGPGGGSRGGLVLERGLLQSLPVRRLPVQSNTGQKKSSAGNSQLKAAESRTVAVAPELEIVTIDSSKLKHGRFRPKPENSANNTTARQLVTVGRGAVVLVSGQAGSGKTTLLTELALQLTSARGRNRSGDKAGSSAANWRKDFARSAQLVYFRDRLDPAGKALTAPRTRIAALLGVQQSIAAL